MYKIKEEFKGEDLESITKVIGSYTVPGNTTDISYDDYAKAPTTIEAYRLR